MTELRLVCCVCLVLLKRFLYVGALFVTLNNVKLLSVAQKCFYGEFMSQATLKVPSSSCKVPDIFFRFDPI